MCVVRVLLARRRPLPPSWPGPRHDKNAQSVARLRAGHWVFVVGADPLTPMKA